MHDQLNYYFDKIPSKYQCKIIIQHTASLNSHDTKTTKKS